MAIARSWIFVPTVKPLASFFPVTAPFGRRAQAALGPEPDPDARRPSAPPTSLQGDIP